MRSWTLKKVLICFPILVGASLLLIASTGFFFLLRWPALPNSNWLPMATMFDFVLIIPLAYWLIVRRSGVKAITIFPMVVLGLRVGWLVMPPEHSNLVTYFSYVVYPMVAIAVVTVFGTQIKKGIHLFRNQHVPDRIIRIENVTSSIVGKHVFMKSLSQEIATLYYLLRRTNHKSADINDLLEVPTTATTFSYHRKSGMTALLLVGIMIMFVELAAVHMLLGMFSHLLAWLATFSSLYFGLLIVAQTRAIRSRPIYLDDGALHIRNGIFNLASIELENVRSVVATPRVFESELPLNACFPASHNVVLDLHSEGVANLLYGKKKVFGSVLLNVDDPQQFVELVKPETQL